MGEGPPIERGAAQESSSEKLGRRESVPAAAREWNNAGYLNAALMAIDRGSAIADPAGLQHVIERQEIRDALGADP